MLLGGLRLGSWEVSVLLPFSLGGEAATHGTSSSTAGVQESIHLFVIVSAFSWSCFHDAIQG